MQALVAYVMETATLLSIDLHTAWRRVTANLTAEGRPIYTPNAKRFVVLIRKKRGKRKQQNYYEYTIVETDDLGKPIAVSKRDCHVRRIVQSDHAWATSKDDHNFVRDYIERECDRLNRAAEESDPWRRCASAWAEVEAARNVPEPEPPQPTAADLADQDVISDAFPDRAAARTWPRGSLPDAVVCQVSTGSGEDRSNMYT